MTVAVGCFGLRPGLASVTANSLSLIDGQQEHGTNPQRLNSEAFNTLLNSPLLDSFFAGDLSSRNRWCHTAGIIRFVRPYVKKNLSAMKITIDNSFAGAYCSLMAQLTRLEQLNLKANAAQFIFCLRCNAELTSADDEMSRCTQCKAKLPPMRRLLIKIGDSYINDPGTSDLDDKQPVSVSMDLGDVRLAWRLLR